MSNQKLESHVVSLEIARELKGAGWEKETEFWWVITLTSNWHISMGKPDEGWCILNKGNYFAAPLATEILEELPYRIKGQYGLRIYKFTEYNCQVCYWDLDGNLKHDEFDKFLPNALAKMWLYLKKENLL